MNASFISSRLGLRRYLWFYLYFFLYFASTGPAFELCRDEVHYPQETGESSRRGIVQEDDRVAGTRRQLDHSDALRHEPGLAGPRRQELLRTTTSPS